MRLPKFIYFKPSTVAEVCYLMSKYQDEARPLAGGTALLVDLGQRLVTPRYIIRLNGIPMLDYIKEDRSGWLRIGACTTIDSLYSSALVKAKYPFLSHAAGVIGVPAIRIKGTVGGNISLDNRCIFYNQSQFWRRSNKELESRLSSHHHKLKNGSFSERMRSIMPSNLALWRRQMSSSSPIFCGRWNSS